MEIFDAEEKLFFSFFNENLVFLTLTLKPSKKPYLTLNNFAQICPKLKKGQAILFESHTDRNEWHDQNTLLKPEFRKTLFIKVLVSNKHFLH